MAAKNLLLAALATVLVIGTARADDNSQLAALTPDGQSPLLPLSKLKKIAAVSVAEIAPEVAVRVLPDYPTLAQKARIQGMVFARVLVDEEGRVERVGKIKGHAVFREAVAKAADQWQFKPARQGDRPVKAWVNVPFSFEL